MLAILALVSLLISGAYGNIGLGSCPSAVQLPNFNMTQVSLLLVYTLDLIIFNRFRNEMNSLNCEKKELKSKIMR